MKKIIILVPVYNDWESLSKLLSEINISINGFDKMIFDCVIINDASTLPQPEIKKNSNFNSIKIISMIENRGHARCNAFGLQYISKNFTFDHLILMDGDGEDRPVEIQSLLKKALEYENSSVVAKRIKRSEGPLFQYLYQMHKTITFLFTGKKIHFGNYRCIRKKDVNILSHQPSLWSSFSGSLSKHINNLKEIDSIRGLRYFGPSKMSLFKLLIHSDKFKN